jgi:hypothetical protein
VKGFVGYASRWLRVPDRAWPGDMRLIAQLPMPGNTKGGILYPQDNGLHVISLFGQAHDYPPAGEAAFMSFLEKCATPLLHAVVSRSEIVSEISTSRSTANRWRHYERLSSPPTGFVTVGDAVACFNPTLGQGITSACLGSVMLGQAITELEGDLDKLPGVFQPRLAARLAYPWHAATGFDLLFPETEGERPKPNTETAERHRYMDILTQVATADLEVQETILLASQTFNPGLVRNARNRGKVDAWVAEGRKPGNTDPTRVPSLTAERPCA